MLQRMIGYVVQFVVNDAGQTRLHRQGIVVVKSATLDRCTQGQAVWRHNRQLLDHLVEHQSDSEYVKHIAVYLPWNICH